VRPRKNNAGSDTKKRSNKDKKPRRKHADEGSPCVMKKTEMQRPDATPCTAMLIGEANEEKE
jgi:hypothetical protein